MKRVVVIGGGPAGAATALALRARSRAECILVERRTFPRTKVCGSGLSPWTLAWLDRIGVGQAVRREAYRIDGALIAGSSGPGIELRGHHETAVLLRERFDALLVDEAVRRGASLRDGLRVRKLLTRGERTVGVETEDGELEADWVVDCSGATGKLGNQTAGLTLSTALAWYEGMARTSDVVELYFDSALKPHYGWVFPESATRVNVGIVYAPGPGGTARERFESFVERRLGDRLEGATRIGKLTGCPVAVSAFPAGLGGPGLLVAGEAARLADAATAEGIYHALVSGTLAGLSLAEAEPAGNDALRAYQRRTRGKLGPHMAGGRALMTALRSPALDLALRLGGFGAMRTLLRRAFTGLYHG
jgi:geranylgeranyl reductase family protein